MPLPIDIARYANRPKLYALLSALNPHQLEVVMTESPRVAVCGVPGAGKTATLIGLISRMVADGVDPNGILAMTFTKAAAEEMNKRLHQMDIPEARVGTIHSVAFQLLTENGFMSDLTYDDRGRLYVEMQQAIQAMQRDRRCRLSRDQDVPKVLRGFVDMCKMAGAIHVHGDLFSANQVLDSAVYAAAEKWVGDYGAGLVTSEQCVNLYLDYEKRRSIAGLIDFDDMLGWAWLALVRFPAVLNEARKKYHTVIVDEGQDSNPLQWDIARLLVGMNSCVLGEDDNFKDWPFKIGFPQVWLPEEEQTGKKLYIVGAPSQAIYSWRGAAPKLFTDYTERDDVSVLRLPLNYRSLPGICAAGTGISKGEEWNLEGAIEPVATGEVASTLPEERSFASTEQESAAALEWAKARIAESGTSEVAILSRTALGLSFVEIECIRQRIPYVKRASSSFFDSREVKELLDYIRVASGLDNTGAALRRIVNVPFRYFGSALLKTAETRARECKIDLLTAMGNLELKRSQKASLQELLSLIRKMNLQAIAGEQKAQDPNKHPGGGSEIPGPAGMISTLLNRTNYLEEVQKREGWTLEGGRLAVVKEFQRITEMFVSPRQFVEYMDQLAACVDAARKQGLRQRETGGQQALTLSTIHRAKGLEWNSVWLCSVVPGCFPPAKATVAGMPEERRLFYVAVTRARHHCVVSHTQLGAPDSDLSPFIPLLRKVRKENGAPDKPAESDKPAQAQETTVEDPQSV